MPAYAPEALFDLPETAAASRPAPPGRRPAHADPGRTTYDDIDRDTYLGTHHPHWLELPELGSRCVPLCVSHRRLAERRSLPRACTPWMLDSGGFSELSLYGEWTVSPAEYAVAVRRYADEISELDFAAIQDWMVEPEILAKTGLSLYDHQCRTVASYLNLLWLDDELPWMPVLQGWTLEDYLRCVDMYAAMGIDLTVEPRVGLGSVCRRQRTKEAVRIVETLTSLGLRLHGFGFKITGLRQAAHLLYSSDSLSWSVDAMWHESLPGCSTHQRCQNCVRYAIGWRNRMLNSLPERSLPSGYQTVAAVLAA